MPLETGQGFREDGHPNSQAGAASSMHRRGWSLKHASQLLGYQGEKTPNREDQGEVFMLEQGILVGQWVAPAQG